MVCGLFVSFLRGVCSRTVCSRVTTLQGFGIGLWSEMQGTLGWVGV